MKTLAATMLLAALLASGCAIEVGGGAAVPSTRDQREREVCEQSRGGGVWIATVGACVRGGGGG
jgi:hypothetical protein